MNTQFRFTIIREENIDYDSGGNKCADWSWTVINTDGETLVDSVANLDDALEAIQIACLTE